MKILLQHAAHARSGDKGNTSNICVIAYAPELYAPLKEQLTAECFKLHYAGVVHGSAELRFLFPCESEARQKQQRGGEGAEREFHVKGPLCSVMVLAGPVTSGAR